MLRANNMNKIKMFRLLLFYCELHFFHNFFFFIFFINLFPLSSISFKLFYLLLLLSRQTRYLLSSFVSYSYFCWANERTEFDVQCSFRKLISVQSVSSKTVSLEVTFFSCTALRMSSTLFYGQMENPREECARDSVTQAISICSSRSLVGSASTNTLCVYVHSVDWSGAIVTSPASTEVQS